MSGEGTVTQASIHHQLLYFYITKDPDILRNGFDIKGLVRFTLEKGIDTLNRMLFNKYSITIDFFDDCIPDSALAMDYNKFSPNAFDQRQSYLNMILFFLAKHDQTMCHDNRAVEAFLRFSLENGMQELSIKFEDKYGFPVVLNRPRYLVDIARLFDDLQLFFSQVQQADHNEDIVDIIRQVFSYGIDNIDEKFKGLFGVSLNEFNTANGRKGHFVKALQIKIPRGILKRDLEVYYADLGHSHLARDINTMMNFEEVEGIGALNDILRESFGISLDEYNETIGKRRYQIT